MLVPRVLASLAAVLLGGGLLAGCGVEEGVSEGAVVHVYVSGPMEGVEAGEGRRLCREAGETLGRVARRQGEAGRIGGVEVRSVCIDASGRSGRWTLARVGENARTASEDSAAVAYIGEPDPGARRQSVPILEAAGIASLGGASGAEAMRAVLEAIEGGDEDDPRAAVYDAVSGG